VSNRNPSVDSKLIPILREAVVTVQMVLFRHLKARVCMQHKRLSPQEQSWLTGAVINSLYGNEPADSSGSGFVRQHRELIEMELRQLHQHVQDLLPYLTDSLRMQALCDQCEGRSSMACLLLAKELGLLVEEQPVPLPSAFMRAVRNLAAGQGLTAAVMRPAAPQEN
jgi:hypothetical protein